MSAIDQINQGGTTYEIVPEIAELFSISKTYHAGDHVIYEAGWYTFKDDKYAGAWDSTKVNGPFKVTNELSNLKNTLTQKTDLTEFYNAFPVDTASGAIASFTDGAELPLKSLTVDIEPIQDLHGYDNPWPAGGGANQWDEQWEVGGIENATGLPFSASDRIRSKNFSPCLASTNYYGVSPSPYLSIFWYTSNNEFISWEAAGNHVITSPATAAYFKVVLANNTTTYGDNIAINYPATVTTYSPYSNICPISGHTQAVVTRTGVNLWDEETANGYWDVSSGEFVASSSWMASKNYIHCLPNTQYYYCYTRQSGSFGAIVYYDNDKSVIGYNTSLPLFTTPNGCRYMTFYTNNGWTNISINYPSTDHEYHAYSGQSINIDLGQTVYGGKLDVLSGELVIDREMVDLGTLTWSYDSINGYMSSPNALTNAISQVSGMPNAICSHYPCVASNGLASADDKSFTLYNGKPFVKDSDYTNASTFTTAMSGAQLVYQLATPTTVQLTPHEATALLGSNNVWADSGNSEVVYRADPTLYIQRLTEPDADMIADANIVSGQYFMVGNTLYKATANIASGGAITPNVNCTRKSLSEALNELNV